MRKGLLIEGGGSTQTFGSQKMVKALPKSTEQKTLWLRTRRCYLTAHRRAELYESEVTKVFWGRDIWVPWKSLAPQRKSDITANLL